MKKIALMVALLLAVVAGAGAKGRVQAKPQTHKVGARQSRKVVPAAPKSSVTDVTVSVNTKSGVYHFPGCRWYGTTKNAESMKLSKAQKAGYRACLKCGR